MGLMGRIGQIGRIRQNRTVSDDEEVACRLKLFCCVLKSIQVRERARWNVGSFLGGGRSLTTRALSQKVPATIVPATGRRAMLSGSATTSSVPASVRTRRT